jgi:two-component system response regulator AtoC
MLLRMLLAAADPSVQERVARLLGGGEVAVSVAAAENEVWQQLCREPFDLLVADRRLLADHGAAFVSAIRRTLDPPEVIVLSEREDAQGSAALLAEGTFAALSLELDDASLGHALQAVVARYRQEAVRRMAVDGAETPWQLSDFLFPSPVMQTLMGTVRRAVGTDSALLILGETGVGKKSLGRAIHAGSSRSDGPFMALNCAALPEDQLERELFGCEEGAQAGASRAHRGYFELAHRGAVYLGEIGALPLRLQGDLLRVLEDGQVRQVGGKQPLNVDVRLIAAAPPTLEEQVKAGAFRKDLFYRLAVVTVQIPPLRDRPEDVPILAEKILARFRSVLGRPAMGLQPEALQALVSYSWPGNVRELVNVLERAMLLSPDRDIRVEILPRSVRESSRPEGAGSAENGRGDLDLQDPKWLGIPLPRARREVVNFFERSYLAKLLESASGSIGEAARRAGIHERTLYELMRRHGLKKETFKSTTRKEAAGDR